MYEGVDVFPAHAGMFLVMENDKIKFEGFPRARGDVPPDKPADLSEELFSPRTRGCSWRLYYWGDDQDVFPAHAGMFP